VAEKFTCKVHFPVRRAYPSRAIIRLITLTLVVLEAAWLIRVGLSAIRATAARHALVLDDLAIKVVLGLDNAANEHPAVHAGVGALEAGVVRLYGVVVIIGGWVRVGCARLCAVHSEPPSSVGRAPGCSSTCGATSLYDVVIIHAYVP
jgi:hypothetical protein